jgi:serine O-acetyltransferase
MMRRIWIGIRMAASGLRLVPHLLVFALSRQRATVIRDAHRWAEIIFEHPEQAPRSSVGTTVYLLSFHPEFRNLFYYRTGRAGRIFSFLCRPLPTLYITTPEIGPGLYIQHGFATIISAKRIGVNCWINQQVTIGYSNRHDAPTLGDNVTVHAGAKVIGAVTVGNNARIGANAVVVKDVPENVTVIGVPARIVRRDGTRTNEPLA